MKKNDALAFVQKSTQPEMDQYGLSYLCLAALFITVVIFKFMYKQCYARSDLHVIALALTELNAKFQQTQLQGLCVCVECAKASGVLPSRRPSIAVVVSADEKIEATAIGVRD